MSVSLFPLSHSLSLTHTLYLSHTLSIPLSHSLYPSLTSLFLSHPPTLALAAHLCVCLYHSLTYSHTHTHTHTRKNTHTQTHTDSTWSCALKDGAHIDAVPYLFKLSFTSARLGLFSSPQDCI